MICSELELSLGEGHEGIVVLPEDAPLGVPLGDYMGDTILELELTPNRLDCLSILGTAHEVAALTGKTVTHPEVSYPGAGPPVSDGVSISIADPDLCHRYTATVIPRHQHRPIPGLGAGTPHPRRGQAHQQRGRCDQLYVMLEFNQPLHAFDYQCVKERTVIVRRARPGESLTTLDGVERRLTSNILVIADSTIPLGLGGVIGGANSEIGPDTTDVLLESATFDDTTTARPPSPCACVPRQPCVSRRVSGLNWPPLPCDVPPSLSGSWPAGPLTRESLMSSPNRVTLSDRSLSAPGS